jgi:hypothetical protein
MQRHCSLMLGSKQGGSPREEEAEELISLKHDESFFGSVRETERIGGV